LWYPLQIIAEAANEEAVARHGIQSVASPFPADCGVLEKETTFNLMPRPRAIDPALLQAALEGLEHQKQEVDKKIAAVRSLLVVPRRGRRAAPAAPKKPRRKLSAAARKRISEAQKQRWALLKAKAAAKKSK